MSIKLISVKCPDCGAQLNIEEGRKTAFCSYCGSKILIRDENEITIHEVNEAELRKAETDRIVRVRQMDYAEKLHAARERKTQLRIKATIILAVIGGALFIIGWFGGSLTGDSDSPIFMLALLGFFPFLAILYIWIAAAQLGENELNVYNETIKIPSGVSSAMNDYRLVERHLKNAGFTNISCVPLNDLKLGMLYKPNQVQSITANGEYVNHLRRYPRDAKIIVSYHSRSR